MSKILYEVYQNQISDDENVMKGKWYARVKTVEQMNTSKMSKHISEHGSVYTEDVVEGVLKKFKGCLLEMLLESKSVKIDGLGIFRCTIECNKGGADKEEDFNVRTNIKALHIRFIPDQTAENNISSREFLKKAEFVNVKNLLKSDGDGEGTEENGEGTGSTEGTGSSEGTGTGGNGGSTEGGGTTGGTTDGSTEPGEGD